MKKQSLMNLDQRVAEVEKRTGAQIVLAVIERSDAYPGKRSLWEQPSSAYWFPSRKWCGPDGLQALKCCSL